MQGLYADVVAKYLKLYMSRFSAAGVSGVWRYPESFSCSWTCKYLNCGYLQLYRRVPYSCVNAKLLHSEI